ncbi:hypothetical protein niasHT_031039 [Heterodera trifolii]|uniref:Uncharacterized protein n=1 Tax=Heterodera trifolii TaxID=157864 RepID=A0ABD2HZ27_9BILA
MFDGADELCRPIDGTPFHEQCRHSAVVKQKGYVPRHLRPPWLNSALFDDNELSSGGENGDVCYACYKGTKASNGMVPGEEYCACTVGIWIRIQIKASVDGYGMSGASPFTFPVVFKNRHCWDPINYYTSPHFENITITLSGE